jgi:L-threonylcarbamoyladenylate synthase
MSTALAATQLAQRLRQGEAAIFPTDTLPALASLPEHAGQLWALKQRPQHKPVILMAASGPELWRWLEVDPLPAWLELADRYWPGALTLVLPAASRLVEPLHPGGNSIGVRVPACEQALALLQLSGPLATTSANRSGEAPCLSPEQAAQRFPEVPQLGPAPWPQPSGQASTVLRWLETGGWEVLRQGAVVPIGLERGSTE